MTMLDRKTISRGRAPLSAEADAGAPHQKAFDAYIRHGDDDALRGLPLAVIEANLNAMTQAAQQAGAKVLLVGMQVPPNYGAQYGQRFEALFAQVARAHKAALVPFLLKGVADGPDPTRLFQADRIHPTAAAHPIILGNVWPTLQKLLK